MTVTNQGAEERVAELEAQAARLRDPSPVFAAADEDLAEVRAQHPGWRTPGSWYRRFLVRLERFVLTGSV